MKNILIILTLLISFSAHAYIDLDIDRYACLDNDISMNIDIEVDEESFSFDADCDWSFSDNFETADGIECEVSGEMCDFDGQDYGYIEVECNNGEDQEEDFPCSKNKYNQASSLFK